MKLCEHPDFDQAILQAADHFRPRGLRPSVIEKDYYVTEALRSIAAATVTATANLAKVAAAGAGSQENGGNNTIIFKGGTSLSKGWNLIARFSEDIDIFLDPLAFNPPLGKRGIDRELKTLRDVVTAHPALTFVEGESQTIGGFGRNDRFSYHQRFGGPGEIANRVLLEAGTASERQPTTQVELSSYVSQYMRNIGVSLGTDDEQPFPMRLLHFRRTFVEKMFAIHGKVESMKRNGQPLGSYARHYYDLFQLAAQPEVTEMLKSAEYDEIKTDYDRVSRQHFDRSYFFPEGMRFAASDALFPTSELEAPLKREYEAQCRLLCYGPYPSWQEIKARFLELRDSL